LVRLGPPSQVSEGHQLTDARGRFVFSKLSPGAYSLSVTNAGFADASYGHSTSVLGAKLIIGDGQWFDGATVNMVRLGTIGGRVVDELGDPVVGALVRTFARLSIGAREYLASGPVTQTDDRGEYRLTNLLPDRYFVMVPSVQNSIATDVLVGGAVAADSQTTKSRPRAGMQLLPDGRSALVLGTYVTPHVGSTGRTHAYPTTFYPGAATAEAAESVEVVPGGTAERIDFALRPLPSVRVSGQIEGIADYSGFVLRLVRAGLESIGIGGEQATTTVSPSGKFTFLNVPPGQYSLLAPGATVELVMRSAVAGRRSILPTVPGLGASASGLSGGYLGPGVPASYSSQLSSEIRDSHAGFGRLSITVGDRDVTGVTLRVEPGAVMRGVVEYDESVAAPARALVELIPSAANFDLGIRTTVAAPSRDQTSRQAAFSLPAIPAGGYFLRLSMPAAAGSIKSISLNGVDSTRQPLALASGATVDVRVTVTGKIITVKGLVRDRAGRPSPGTTVMIFAADCALRPNCLLDPNLSRTAISSSDGTYELRGMSPGEYAIVALDSVAADRQVTPELLKSLGPRSTKLTLDWGATFTVDLGPSR